MAINQYIQEVSRCIHSLDGLNLRNLISIQSASAQQAVMSALVSNPRWNPASSCNRLPGEWSEFMTAHCLSLAALQSGNRVEAYTQCVNAMTVFNRIFREESGPTGAWVVHPMHSVVHNLRDTAAQADTELQQGGAQATKLVDCGDQLRKCFSVSLQAPGNTDKRLAALDIINESIKIYFKLNTLRLCKNLIKTVESRQFPDFNSFPISQRVTYKFYMGRLGVFDEAYLDAEESLSYALKHCHINAEANRAKILKYLVPVQMLLGHLPTQALLDRYNLQQYKPLITAMKTGDVALFDNTMNERQFDFIQQGTYLLLEKLRQAVFRRLLRRVWVIWGQAEPAKSNQIPLSWFHNALVSAGGKLDIDEVECICANLIYKKYVKGYIAHKSKVLVVSKANPFPSLVTVMKNTAES